MNLFYRTRYISDLSGMSMCTMGTKASGEGTGLEFNVAVKTIQGRCSKEGGFVVF